MEKIEISLCHFLWGVLVCEGFGTAVVWFLIDKVFWRWMLKNPKKRKWNRTNWPLSLPLGIVERFLYMVAFIYGIYAWVLVWLTLKTAIKYQRWEKGDKRGAYNAFLIGSGLNILFGVIGALIALDRFPF